ncbi:RICIN domain-containing protein [Kitasatospora sp. NPDC093806]|uniref:RICIN domain-containing protein n=1 Tax=Kitasatospora sp. NPDC093806 TaxID=3155075 RepID=UPI003443955F
MTTPLNTTRRLGSAAAATALALGAGLLTAAPANADGGYDQTWFSDTTFVNILSGKCLEVGGWRTDDGAPVNQWACTGGANQKWRFTDGQLINVNSGKCLDVPGWDTTPGIQLTQWECNGGDNQRWSAGVMGVSGMRRIFDKHTLLVLDAAGASKEDGAPVIQWTRNSGANQAWGPGPNPGLGA